jgi:hypothetical protein
MFLEKSSFSDKEKEKEEREETFFCFFVRNAQVVVCKCDCYLFFSNNLDEVISRQIQKCHHEEV